MKKITFLFLSVLSTFFSFRAVSKTSCKSFYKVFICLVLVFHFAEVNAQTPPTISSFTPLTGNVGATVTITGTNFHTTAANNIVLFGATKAIVSAATATSPLENADLEALSISGDGTLSPTFTPSTTAYTAIVSNAITSITVTPTQTTSNATATIQVRVNAGSYVAVDPLLGSLADNGGFTKTYSIGSGSPAIDKGTTTDLLLDQRGSSIVGTRDIGSYEYSAPSESNTVPSYIVSGAGTAAVNGVYVHIGKNNSDKLVWQFGSYYLTSNIHGEAWIGSDPNDPWSGGQYYADSSDTDPTQWNMSREMGADPAPIIELATSKVNYASSELIENSANDGTVTATTIIAHNNYESATFTGTDGENFITSGKAVVTGVPAGLTVVIIRNNNLELTFSLTGNASAHANANDINNLNITFQDAAFSDNDAANTANYDTNLSINFIQQINVGSGQTYTTIQSAVDAAGNGDVLLLAAETFTEQNITITNKSLTIIGVSPASTIVQAHAVAESATDRVFKITHSSYSKANLVFLEKITIRNGNSARKAGGLYGQNTTIRLKDCSIESNSTTTPVNAGYYGDGGGGIQLENSNLIAENCTFFDNHHISSYKTDMMGGGAIAFFPNDQVNYMEISNCTFSDNSSGAHGGAIMNKPTITNDIRITNSTFVGNSAPYGGAYRQMGSGANPQPIFLINSLFYGNTASLGGSQMYSQEATNWTVDNCLIEDTSAAGLAGVFKDCIVGVDPLLGSLADNGGFTKTYSIGSGSPAIDKGTTTDLLLDQRGSSILGTRDIGSYEYSAPTNQNTVYANSSSVTAGDAVTIVSSADATNNVWFAPAGTTTFVASATMTMAASGTATSILAPASGGAYKLFVIDAAGNVSNESTATLTTTIPPPSAPENLIAYANSTTGIVLNWTDNAFDETNYKVERADDYAFSTNVTTIAAALASNTTSYEHAAGTASKYFYRVTPTNGSEDSTSASSIEFATTEVFPVRSLNLDGSGDYLQIAPDATLDFGGTNNLTVEAWIKPTTVNGSSGVQAIVNQHNGGNGEFMLQLNDDKIQGMINVTNVFRTLNGTSTIPQGVWTHIALTYDGTMQKLYVNGAEDNSSQIGPNTIYQYDHPTRIGSSSFNQTFAGEIDEVRIWKKTKSDFSDRTTALNGDETDLVAYYPFDEGATTTLDRSVNTNNPTFSGDASLTGGAFNTDITAPTNQNTVYASSSSVTAGDAVTIISSADATNNVWFAPAETTTFVVGTTMTKAASGTATSILAPVSGGAYKLFVIDAAENVSAASTATLISIVENALHFDGTNDYVELDDVPFDFEYSDPITIEAWFKRDSNTQQMIYSKSGSGYYELAFVGEKLFFQLQNGGSNNLQAETVNTFTDSNWHHVAFTYDGSNDSNNFNFYVDGVLEQKNLIANNAFGGTGSVLSDNPAYIGARSGTGSYFNGQLDEVRIWSDVRTPAEIQANITTQLVGNEANLLAYYDFNIGISSGDNTGLTTLTDLTSNENNGTLRNFALTGASSNWVASNALSTDITAPTNQNTVYASSSAIPAGDAVTIVSSADVTNNVWFAPAGTTTFVASATMTMAASGTATSILAPVSVGEYKLFVIDAAGNVSAASTATLTAVVENALDFDGVDDYVISNLSGTNVGSYSIEMYIKPNITQSTKGIFTWAPALGSGSAMVIIQQNCTSVDLYVDGNYRIFINVPINSWSHLALTFDGSSYKAYLNGTLSGTYTGGNAGLSFADDIYLGNGYNGYWNGQMDEVRIWDAERTASQITDNMSSSLSGSETGLLAYYNMQNGSGTTLTDLTGSNDGTLTNMDSNDWVAGYSLDSEVDITAPTNQDTVYPISSTIPAGDPVTIVSSGDPTNNVWFAPTGTNSFVEGTTMTKSTTDCTTTSILAPASFGEYKLFVIDAAGNASAASTATLTAFNEPPVITSASTANFVENGTGTAYTITATDTNVITYSLGTGNDEALFNIIGGVLTFINAPDQQTKETYTIEVRANDGTNTASKNVVITIIRQLNTFTTDGNWSDSNWSHGIPTENEDVIIAGNVSVTLDVDDISIYNFTLNTGAILVIPKDKELTIRGDFITNGSLSLGSDSADSGVLFVEGSASGTITYKRGGLLGNKWSLVTAPVSGQKILSFAQSSTNNLRTRTETPVKYAIGWYDSSQNSSDAWQYYTADTPASQEFLQGDSYSMSRSTDGEVSFTGSLNVDNISKTLMANRWSAIGNPYTTYLAANKNSASSFLNDNLASLHDTSQAIYIWDKGEEKYVAVSEVDVSTRSLTPGQGFFIRMKGDQTNISFNKNKRQLKPATGTTVFEKNQTTAPEIVVSVSNSSVTVKTNIKYFDTATTGLDPGYDIGNFNGASLDVFTHLLEDGDAVNYTIQSLPKKGFEDLIIPLGIKTDAGTELTFTADSIDLPADLQVFIEDSVLNVFTALNETSAYTINIDNDMDGIGRFYIHTAKTVLSTTNVFGLNDVMLYVKDATTLSISGLTGGQTKLKLYSLVGKQILKTTFEGSGEREVSIPSLSAGVYLVKLQTKEGELTKKIILE